MRTRFRENVDRLAADLATMCVHAESAVADATGALLTVDLDLAEQVITTREWFDTAAQGWEHRALALLALQAPVASDLRTLVGGLDVTSDLQRMGDLAVDIADLTRHRHPVAVVPEEVRGVFADMGRLAAAHAAVAEYVLRHRDVDRNVGLERAGDEMSELNRCLLERITSPRWPHGVEAAIDVSLLARFYERFSDHAAAIGRRVVFLETGSSGT